MSSPDWEPTAPDELLDRVKARGVHLRWRRQASVLSTCIAVLAIAGLISATAVGPSGDATTIAASGGSSGSPTTTVAGPDGSTTTTAAGDDAGPAGSSTTTTASPSPPTTRSQDDDGESTTTVRSSAPSTTAKTTNPERATFPSPRAGTYRYRAQQDETTSEERLVYEETGRDGDEVRLLERWTDAADEDPTQLSWRPTGVVVLTDGPCERKPPATRYVFPMREGSSWSSDSVSCPDNGTGELRRRTTSTVTDRTTETIAGQSVDLFVIATRGTTETTVAGVRQTFYVEETEWFSPAHGLAVRIAVSVRQTDKKSGAERNPKFYEILNLDPE